MKKFFCLIAAALAFSVMFAGCADNGGGGGGGTQPPPETDVITPLPSNIKTNLSADGYVAGKISDFTEYEGTDAYRTVTTADEFIEAIAAAKYHYTNVWDEATGTYSQVPETGYTEENFEGTVHVIEIANDLDLGFYKMSAAAKSSGLVVDYATKLFDWEHELSVSDMAREHGISQIKIEKTSNLLVYSKTGAKLTHCGFKLTSDTNVVFRNLQFDEIWQWEDAPVSTKDGIGDYDWYGWAYFKISFSGYIWIDHCTFGKSYDGQIDYSNPNYTANPQVAERAPYGADGGNGLHISFCRFNAGSDDPDGYIYKMMQKIEAEYQAGEHNYLYYNALREGGASFNDILYGLALPQKKGFLCGDNAKYDEPDYTYNLGLQVSFSNCVFKNLEDRLPKLRGGNAYMYNCVVDSSQYYAYRANLKSINAAAKVSAVKSNWKCGLVSQGIVCGNGGSVMAESCIFRGIEYLLKNNDTNNSGEYALGGYKLANCSYQRSATDTPYIGSSSSSDNRFSNDTPAKLKTEAFAWHTADGKKPFTAYSYALDSLEATLGNADYGAGVNSAFGKLFLKSVYTA